ncbi:hypothetical protein [Tateyamaria omphalii]|uniref:Pilus assembly protein n=1 Tax=Tateyamaria omphalii TaxID=299262 RepID=A0A1P8MVF3_9RHOB|nr:hypothetical protein [Tateyamaria omphalii]APX12080.1 hypothetical protein BWR18_10605 [Tateyamaria omphalii]
MNRFLTTFKTSERGAVTVDWVVLCAAVVGLAIAVIYGMNSGTLAIAGNVDTYLESQFFTE